MPALQVRDFPQELYDQLKESAAEDHRSIAQQTVYAVEEMLRMRNIRFIEPRYFKSVFNDAETNGDFEDIDEECQKRIEKRRKLFAEIHELAKELPKDLPDPVEMVRQGREEQDQRDERLMREMMGVSA